MLGLIISLYCLEMAAPNKSICFDMSLCGGFYEHTGLQLSAFGPTVSALSVCALLASRLLSTQHETISHNCCIRKGGSSTHSLNFNVILPASIQYPHTVFCLLFLNSTQTNDTPPPPGVNIDVVMETVIVIWIHPFFFFSVQLCAKRDLYSFPSKCQGNNTDTYRKCQRLCLTKDMESDSRDKQYFSFPCQREPPWWCIFYI